MNSAICWVCTSKVRPADAESELTVRPAAEHNWCSSTLPAPLLAGDAHISLVTLLGLALELGVDLAGHRVRAQRASEEQDVGLWPVGAVVSWCLNSERR